MRTFVYCFVLFSLLHVPNVQTTLIEPVDEETHVSSQGSPWKDNFITRYLVDLARAKRYIVWQPDRRNISPSNTGECATSADDFPQVIVQEDIERGAIILVFLVGIYCFTLLAIICDKYFLPCVETICEYLHLSHDVAAATFMSVATSAPELFVNLIGTFVTESDLGIGTVVGSSLFNSLGVASLGGLAASTPLQLHWWPVTRDIIIYMLSIILLIGITWDGKIYWYEGLVLFIVYFMYFTVLFQNVRIARCVKKMLKRKNKVEDLSNQEKGPQVEKRPSVAVISSYGSYAEEPISKYIDPKALEAMEDSTEQRNSKDKIWITENSAKEEDDSSIFKLPKGSFIKKTFFYYSWPIKFVLFFTIPDPQRHPRLFPVTFLCCIFWIGTNSYVVSWMITIIGATFKIPDAVLGLTFLAAGGCLPEAISITIMSRRGEGSMGVSNSLGANTMNILLSLGMPWFLKTITMGTSDGAMIVINSGALIYTISGLIFVAISLYLTLYFHKFQLCRSVGFILIGIYLVCLVLAILSEMVFFERGCETRIMHNL